MSKIGKKPILIPKGIAVIKEGGFLTVKGPKGELKIKSLPNLRIEIEGDKITVRPESSEKQAMANWGSMASLLKNAISGVEKEFSKILIIEGVGYRAALEGNKVVLQLGFTNPINYEIPEGIKVGIEKNATIKISGINKEVVGEVAAEIRAFKKPEPYKGKGIHYENEVVRRKAGKKMAGTTGTA
jgi:large subunit ribosomal protein L6